LGEKGMGEILQEIPDAYTHLCCSVGTGASFKGLLQAAAIMNSKIQLEAFAIIKQAEYLNETFQACGYPNYRFHTESHGGGYAKTNAALIAFMENFSRSTGILCDQVYEAKLLQYLDLLIQENQYPKGSKILVLHNGGLSGMLSLFA
jgi:1-aminocyclopropane-1-carboxylate deaminase